MRTKKEGKSFLSSSNPLSYLSHLSLLSIYIVCLRSTTPLWFIDTPDTRTTSTTRNSPVSQENIPQSCRQHQRYHNTAVHHTPSTTLTDACLLGHDTPIRPWNPYTCGTAKHTRRQNINRNVKLHLRNDRKQTQEDAREIQQIDLHHHNTYYVLLAFDEWHHRTRFTSMVLVTTGD